MPWDAINDKGEVAKSVVFLLGDYSTKITGQTLYVDGGASVVGGELLKHEKPLKTMTAKKKEARERLKRMQDRQKKQQED